MNPIESAKIGQPSEPGEYDDGMQALLQIIWGEGFLSPGGAAEVAPARGQRGQGCVSRDFSINAITFSHGIGPWCMAKTVSTIRFSRFTACETSYINSGS